jgi:hypothetical protein
MRVIAVFFGPCTPDVLISHISIFSHYFKRLDRFTKLATSSPEEQADLRSPGKEIRFCSLSEVIHACPPLQGIQSGFKDLYWSLANSVRSPN